MRRLLTSVSVVAALVLALAGCKVITDDGTTVTVPNCVLPTVAPTAVTSGTCTWTASPAPTTTTPSSTTTTTTTTSPPPAGFPTPATTGAPAGTVFQPVHNGNLTITKAGTYSGLHVTGAVIVTVPGVTITDSWIEGIGVNANEPLDNESTPLGSARMTVSHTTIGNPAVCNPQPGLGEHDYTAIGVRIIGMGDGFRVSGSNVTVRDSFVQTCDDPLNHDDGIQTYCPPQHLPQPCRNILVNHNTLSVAGTRNFTAPMFGGDNPGGPNGQLADSTYSNNLLWGGVFSIYLYGSGLTITGNRVATNPWTDPDGTACAANSTGTAAVGGCSYRGWVWSASDVTCSTVAWSDNQAVTVDTATWQPIGKGKLLNCA